MTGRTTWWAKDAAWNRRENVVELGEQYGPGGVTVLDVLSCWGQEQRDGGRVRGGWRTLAREAFVQVDDARAIVEHAERIGALDDLQVDEDGRRFSVRVSGWKSDQERGRSAFRKAASRDDGPSGTDPDAPGRPGTDQDLSRSVPASAQPDQNKSSSSPLPPKGADAGSNEEDDEAEPSSRRRSRRVDPSQLPDDFPDDLLPAIAAVLPVLRRVHGMRGGTEPTRRGVALAVHRFPDRDHAAVAGELEQWATAGNGTRRNVKDWSGTFASFLGRSPACEPRTGGGAAVGDELEQHRRRVAAAQRRREEFERGRDRALGEDGAA
jgi:hypothetical protein